VSKTATKPAELRSSVVSVSAALGALLVVSGAAWNIGASSADRGELRQQRVWSEAEHHRTSELLLRMEDKIDALAQRLAKIEGALEAGK